MALVFRAEVCVAADFAAAAPDLTAVVDAADAAFFDAAEAALVDATDVARDLVDAVVALRDVTRRDVAARLLAACLAGRAAGALGAGALDFETLVLTDEVFTALFRTEALAIVFALRAGALDATAFAVDALAAFGDEVFEVAFAALLLGGMVGTLLADPLWRRVGSARREMRAWER